MIIVNTQEKWDLLSKKVGNQPFVYLQMYSDVNLHPFQNRISCYYIRTLENEYIVPVYHNERFSDIICEANSIHTTTPILVSDLKSYYHKSMIISDEVYDLNWCVFDHQ